MPMLEATRGIKADPDLKDATLVGVSMGGGEVARYTGKYGATRVSKAVFGAAVSPDLSKSADKPDGGLDDATLIVHGEDDQIVPIADSALLSAKFVAGSTSKVYPGAPHGLASTHQEQFRADLLAFTKG